MKEDRSGIFRNLMFILNRLQPFVKLKGIKILKNLRNPIFMERRFLPQRPHAQHTTHSEMLRWSVSKFTPILKSLRLSAL